MKQSSRLRDALAGASKTQEYRMAQIAVADAVQALEEKEREGRRARSPKNVLETRILLETPCFKCVIEKGAEVWKEPRESKPRARRGTTRVSGHERAGDELRERNALALTAAHFAEVSEACCRELGDARGHTTYLEFVKVCNALRAHAARVSRDTYLSKKEK